MPINYQDRIFRSVDESPSGDVSGDTRFHYRQQGQVVWATYEGGGVRFGTLTALVLADDRLDMRYAQVSTAGEVKTGRCLSTPEVLPDGRVRLHEQWQWTEGGRGAGQSVVEEVRSSGDRTA